MSIDRATPSGECSFSYFMSRRKSSPAQETSTETVARDIPEVVAKPAKSKTVRLKLKQNDFINGAFAKAGTVAEFSSSEAQKRLSTEDKWESA